MQHHDESYDVDAPRFGLPDPWPMIGGDAELQAIEIGTATVAGRWKPAILTLLAQRSHRYNVLHRRLPGITAKMLTQQLRELEAAGLVQHDASAHGAKVSIYALTPMGEALRPVIEAMVTWSRAYADFRRYRAEREAPAPAPAPRADTGRTSAARGALPTRAGEARASEVREQRGPADAVWRAESPTRGRTG